MRTCSLLDHGGLPGAGDGLKLGLQARTERGDTKLDARSQHKGQARRPRKVSGGSALPVSYDRSSPIWPVSTHRYGTA